MPIGAALAGVGAVLGGAAGFFGQEDTNAANAIEAEKNRQFQKRMSNTQYQRAVRDLEAAGLNPALAYGQGGAGTPGGAQATMQNEGAAGAQGMQAGIGGAMQLLQAHAQLEQLHAQTRKTDAEAVLSRTQAGQMNTLFSLTSKELEQRGIKLELDNKWQRDMWQERQEQLRREISLLGANARDVNARALITELEQAAARNANAAESTLWKKKFAPYLNDARGVAETGLSIYGARRGAVRDRQWNEREIRRDANREAERQDRLREKFVDREETWDDGRQKFTRERRY